MHVWQEWSRVAGHAGPTTGCYACSWVSTVVMDIMLSLRACLCCLSPGLDNFLTSHRSLSLCNPYFSMCICCRLKLMLFCYVLPSSLPCWWILLDIGDMCTCQNFTQPSFGLLQPYFLSVSVSSPCLWSVCSIVSVETLSTRSPWCAPPCIHPYVLYAGPSDALFRQTCMCTYVIDWL